jgi:hypothetical protein
MKDWFNFYKKEDNVGYLKRFFKRFKIGFKCFSSLGMKIKWINPYDIWYKNF